jgi:hypothetical protein
MSKKLITWLLFIVVFIVTVVGCTDADVVSQNLSKEADNFKIMRRIVFYNGINGEYILTIEGFCSLGNFDAAGEVTVTCKGETGYVKHFLGLSDNVTFFSEQLENVDVSDGHYRVIFKPSTIVPDLELR